MFKQGVWWMVLGLLAAGSVGCLKIDKPLVDLGGDREYESPKERDPAPGVPDSQLTREQRLQRDLAECQQLLEIREKKYRRLEEKRKDEEEYYKDEIEKLEDKIEDLQEENGKLRKELREQR